MPTPVAESNQMARVSDLSMLGPQSLLERPAVGICGSRYASEAGLRHAAEFGRIAAEHGFVVVSGYAKGVDAAAHRGALEAGGATIAVLAEGIEHFRVRKELRDLATPGNLLAISPFAPDARWTTWNAMARNKTILQLSRALFVIEAGEKGGTLQAGLDCIRQGKPLGVLQYPDADRQPVGNTILLQGAAIAVRTPKDLKRLLARLLDGGVVQSGQQKLEF